MANNPLTNKYVAKAHWNFATRSGSGGAESISAHNGPISIPEGAVITKAYYQVGTTISDNGDDSTIISIGYTGAVAAFSAALLTTHIPPPLGFPGPPLPEGQDIAASLLHPGLPPELFATDEQSVPQAQLSLLPKNPIVGFVQRDELGPISTFAKDPPVKTWATPAAPA